MMFNTIYIYCLLSNVTLFYNTTTFLSNQMQDFTIGMNKGMTELGKVTNVHELSTLNVKVSVTIYEQIAELSISLCNLAKDLLKAVEFDLSRISPTSIQDVANLFLKRMDDEFQSELKSLCGKIVDASSSLEHTIQSMCISDMQYRKTEQSARCKCMPPLHRTEVIKAYLDLSIGSKAGKVEVVRPSWACKCNDRVKSVLQMPLTLRALLGKHRIHLQRVQLSADTAKTFATLLIPNILPYNERLNAMADNTAPEPRSLCEKNFKDALDVLQKICGEYK